MSSHLESGFNPDVQIIETHSFDFKQDVNFFMLQNMPKLVEMARFAAWNLTESDRVHVGVSGFAFDPSLDDPRIGFFAGGNYKSRLSEQDYDPEVDVDVIPKNCGEYNVLRSADEDYLMKYIGAFVIASTDDKGIIEGITDFPTSTLHPCDDCGKMMKRSDLVNKDTLIASVGDDHDVMQVQTFERYFRYYKNLQANPEQFLDIPAYRYQDYDWELIAAQYKWSTQKRKLSVRGNKAQDDRRNMKLSRALALKAIRDVLEPIKKD